MVTIKYRVAKIGKRFSVLWTRESKSGSYGGSVGVYFPTRELAEKRRNYEESVESAVVKETANPYALRLVTQPDSARALCDLFAKYFPRMGNLPPAEASRRFIGRVKNK